MIVVLGNEPVNRNIFLGQEKIKNLKGKTMEKFLQNFTQEIGDIIIGDCREVRWQYRNKDDSEIQMVFFKPNPKEEVMFYFGLRSHRLRGFQEVTFKDLNFEEGQLMIEQLEILAAQKISSC